MRLGPQEYRLAQDLAKEARCSVKEIVEIAVRVSYVTFLLRPNGADQLRELVLQSRTIKSQMPQPTTAPPHRARPSQSQQGLTHSPFKDLKIDK